jgi:hypothetical protein
VILLLARARVELAQQQSVLAHSPRVIALERGLVRHLDAATGVGGVTSLSDQVDETR